MKTHMELTEELKRDMLKDYLSVNSKKNPVAQNLKSISTVGLQDAINQYTIFPKNIVSFLYSARDNARNSGWNEVAAELTRNMGEELGTETQGVTHYEMLIQGLAQGLDPSLEHRLRQLQPSTATNTFIGGMRSIISESCMPYVMGGTYALESSAVPELVIVRNAVNEVFTRKTGKPMQEGRLKNFFKYHLGMWEPGHEEGLRTTVAPYVTEKSDQKLFEKGFRKVMSTMDDWWTSLYADSKKLS